MTQAAVEPSNEQTTPRSSVVYFDNGATSWPKPKEVGESMARFLLEDAANPGRGTHKMANASAKIMEQVRQKLATMLHAESADRVVLTHSCTEALNTAIHGIGLASITPDSPIAKRLNGQKPHAVTTMLEHKAVARPLSDLQRRGLIDLDFVTCDADGFLDPEEVLAAVTPRTVLVTATHASNAVGTIQPVASISQLLRERYPNALFMVDAAQSVGVLPVDVQQIGADLLAFPGHKALLGPTGVGALYVGPRAYAEGGPAEQMLTIKQGGSGGGGATMEMPEYLPNRFEAGTPNVVGFVGLLASLAVLPEPAATLAHERAVAARILECVEATEGVRWIGSKDLTRRTGVVSLVFEGKCPQDVAAALDERWSIASRAGDHCAVNAHKAMGTFELGGTVRVGPGPFTTNEDVDTLLVAIKTIAAE